MREHSGKPPARRLRLNCNDPEAWRYHVLRNGERMTGFRNADVAGGKVEVFRMMMRKNADGSLAPTWMIVSHERPDEERFETLTGEIEIVRQTPPAGSAEWDVDYATEEPVVAAKRTLPSMPQQDPFMEAAAVAAAPTALALDFGA